MPIELKQPRKYMNKHDNNNIFSRIISPLTVFVKNNRYDLEQQHPNNSKKTTQKLISHINHR